MLEAIVTLGRRKSRRNSPNFYGVVWGHLKPHLSVSFQIFQAISAYFEEFVMYNNILSTKYPKWVVYTFICVLYFHVNFIFSHQWIIHFYNQTSTDFVWSRFIFWIANKLIGSYYHIRMFCINKDTVASVDITRMNGESSALLETQRWLFLWDYSKLPVKETWDVSVCFLIEIVN